MTYRDECYRDTEAWPVEHGRPVPALAIWLLLLKTMRAKMQADGREADDITDVAWALREIGMDRRQRKCAAYVTRYRPIQTLDGLDPDPRYVALREANVILRWVNSLGRAVYG